MRQTLSAKLEAGRHRNGYYASSPGAHYGAFEIQGPCGMKLIIIASDGEGDAIAEGWEHISVSGRHRCPNWEEMCAVKDLFWTEDELVVQFHPRRRDYVNFHPYCLHLWARRDGSIATPPAILVGPHYFAEHGP